MDNARHTERDDKLPVTPGEQLKRQMRLHGLSAPELADEFTIHAQTIYNVTSGKRQISSKLAVKLSEKFGQPVEFWLGEPLPESFSPASSLPHGGSYASSRPAPPPSVAQGGNAMRNTPQSEPRQSRDFSGPSLDVLVDHELRALVNRTGSGLAISPFETANVSPASYDLTVGLIVTKGFSKLDKYDWGLIVAYERNDETLGEDERDEARALIDEYENDIEFTDALLLDKRDAVGIVMREELKFGGNFLARAGGTTKNSIRGLSIQHGLQVDPGYNGPILITAFNMGLERIELKAGQKILSLEIVRLRQLPEDPYHEDTNSKIARIVERLGTEIANLFDYDPIAAEERYNVELRQNRDVSFVCDGALTEVRSTAVLRVIESLALNGSIDPFELPFLRALGQVTIEEDDANALIRRFPGCTEEALMRARAAFGGGSERRTLKETFKKLELAPGPAIAKLMGIRLPTDIG